MRKALNCRLRLPIPHNMLVKIFKTGLVPLLFILATLFVSSCSTVEPGHYYGGNALAAPKSAYIVRQKDFDEKFVVGAAIQEALARHGVTATAGNLADKPQAVDFYVENEDHWRWDMAMYLFSLDIRFMDNKSGALLGSGAFKQGAFHDFPDAKQKAVDVVESIYQAK